MPVGVLDELVLRELQRRVFTPAELQAILTESRRELRGRSAADRHKLATLHNLLRKADGRVGRLDDAVESVLQSHDEPLQRRVQPVKAERASMLMEMASLRQQQLLLFDRIRPSHLEAFSHVIGAKLRDPSASLARSYMRAVGDTVVVTEDRAETTGRRARLVAAIAGESA